MALRDLFVRVRGDKTHLDSTLKGAEGSLQSFAGKASNWIKGAFAITSIIAFGKAVIGASEALSDKFSFALNGAKGILTEFLRMTATLNFSNFLGQLSEGYEKAYNLAKALDDLKDKNAYVEYVTSGKKQEAGIQQEIVRDKTGKYSLERRKQAAVDLKAIELEIKDMTKGAVNDVYKLEARGWENRNKMSIEKGKQLYETVTGMSETTIQKLEEIYKKAENVYGNKKDVFGSKKAFIRQQSGVISDETIQAYQDYLDLMKNGEEDVIPKLFKIFQNENEGKIAAQERFNGVLRITNTLLAEQEAGITRTTIPGKVNTGFLSIPRLSSFPHNNTLAGAPVTSGVEMSDEQKQWVESWKQAAAEVTDMLSESFITLFENLGKGSFKGFGDSLLKNFGTLLANLGKMLVSLGTTMLLAQTLLKTPSVPTAIAAIAAGAAAMAIGGVMMGAASAGGSSLASGGSGSSYSSSSNPQTIQVYGVIRGKDIYISNQRYIADNG